METPDAIRQMAVNLLMIIWRRIPAEYKSRYRMTIWEQFQNQIKAAAYTESLATFVNSLCFKLGSDLGGNQRDRADAEHILSAGQDRSILKILRNETVYIVLRVRVANQARQDEWADAHQIQEEV